VISFFVPGKPQAQGSKVKGKWGNLREDNKELGPWRERVALVAHATTEADMDTDSYRPLLSGPIAVGLDFVLYRPQSTPKSKTPPATKKPDIDKMERAILDALTHVLWTDDAQVTHVFKRKRVAEVGESPGVWVWVVSAENT
jgi:crossover junction endodeoxyribonuclease RusA